MFFISSLLMPLPVSFTENTKSVSVALQVNVIFPFCGVYLKALESRLKKTRSIFSTSMARVKPSAIYKLITRVISCLRALILKASAQLRTNGAKAASCR